jgi:hypothetical protein
MRNRAKCKLCGTIIESLRKEDVITCSCGQITIEGGIEFYGAYAVNFQNFLRVDDEGNEIMVEYKERVDKPMDMIKSSDDLQDSTPTKKELIVMLEEMIKSIERLPDHAMGLPVNHYDFYSFAALVLSILR